MAKQSKTELLEQAQNELQAIIDDPETPAAVRVQAIQQKVKIAAAMPEEEPAKTGLDSLFE